MIIFDITDEIVVLNNEKLFCKSTKFGDIFDSQNKPETVLLSTRPMIEARILCVAVDILKFL